MLIIAATVLMLTGLPCLWISFEWLSRIDHQRATANVAPMPVEEAAPEPPKERLTKLGRPIVELKLQT